MKYKILYLIPLLAIVLIFSSCEDELDGQTFQAFESKAVGEYMLNDTTYSTFVALLKKANMYNAVNLDFYDTNNKKFLAENSYTVFAPTNAAFKKFFQEKSFPNGIADVDTAFAIAICQYHIIVPLATGLRLDATSFYPGLLKDPTVSMDRLIMKIGNMGTEEAWINNAKILGKMVDCRNGALYKLDAVLDPPLNITSFISTQLKNGPKGTLNIFYEALVATGYDERLSIITRTDTLPSSLLQVKMNYNYTVFAVTDQVFRSKEISSFNDLVTYLGANSDYENVNNALNKFISYHLLDRKMSSRLLAMEPNFETMSAITEAGYQKGDTILNFEKIKITENAGQITLNGHTADAVHILSQNDCKNGVVHFIDGLLPIQTTPAEETYWEFNDSPVIEAYILGLGGFYRADAAGRLQTEASSLSPYFFTFNNPTQKPFVMGYSDCNVDGLASALADLRNKDFLSIYAATNAWIEMYSPVLMPGEYRVDFNFLSVPKSPMAFASQPKVYFSIYYDDDQPAELLNTEAISMYHSDKVNPVEQLGYAPLEKTITITEARKYKFRISFATGGDGSYHYFDYLRFEPVQP